MYGFSSFVSFCKKKIFGGLGIIESICDMMVRFIVGRESAILRGHDQGPSLLIE
jgi:hypothetical protein